MNFHWHRLPGTAAFTMGALLAIMPLSGLAAQAPAPELAQAIARGENDVL